MKTLSYKNVSLNSGFLYEKQMLNKNVTIDAVYNRFYETGRIEAFSFNWKNGMEKQPHYFWDSDVAKWIEGAAYVLQKEHNPELEAKIESIIDEIEKNQDESGYLIFTTRYANRKTGLQTETSMSFTVRDIFLKRLWLILRLPEKTDFLSLWKNMRII